MQHQIEIKQLPSGAKLLLINTRDAASFYFGTYLRSGYRFCDPKLYELPHLLEHLAFEGNQKYPDPQQFNFEVEKNGAYFNAHTSLNSNWYEFVGSPREFRDIVDLAMCQVFQPLFLPDRIKQEKETVTHELNRYIENDARNSGYYNMQAILPELRPSYQERIASLKRITRQSILDFHDQFYSARNSFFVVAGSFNASEQRTLERKLEAGLDGRPQGKEITYKKLQLPQKSIITTHPSHKDSQSHFLLRFIRPDLDEASIPSLKVLSALLGEGQAARRRKAREVGLTYGLNSTAGGDFDMTQIMIWDQTTPEKLKPLIQLVINELRSLANGDFSEAELERAVGYKAGQLERGIETPSRLASWYSDDFLTGLGLMTPQQGMELLRSVQRKDIIAAAQKYVTADNWVLTVIGKQAESQKAELKEVMADLMLSP